MGGRGHSALRQACAMYVEGISGYKSTGAGSPQSGRAFSILKPALQPHTHPTPFCLSHSTSCLSSSTSSTFSMGADSNCLTTSTTPHLLLWSLPPQGPPSSTPKP